MLLTSDRRSGKLKDMTQKILLFGLLILLGTACGHKIYLPDTAMQTPETGGRQWGGSAAIYGGSTTSATLIDDIATTPPTRNLYGVESRSGVPYININLELSLLDSLEVYYGRSLGLKYQFVGRGREPGWKASLFAGAITSRTSSEEIVNSTNTYKAESKLKGTDVGLSVGFREDPMLLYYSTLSVFAGKADTVLTQPSAIYNYEDAFSHVGLSLGVQRGTDWFVLGELSVLSTWIPNKDSVLSQGYAVALGYKW
jgi:hypothetical protein